VTLQEAFVNWQATQRLVLTNDWSLADLKMRNYTWDVYCAVRDGKHSEHYAERRSKYGRPLVSDNEVNRLEAGRRKIVCH
jgi:hypothetical protein